MKLRDKDGYILPLTLKGLDRITNTDWKQTWKYRHGRSSKEIALQYFNNNPEAKQFVAEKYQCEQYEGKSEIKECIFKEEERYFKLLKGAANHISKISKGDIDGKKLCQLHDTYGIDPSVVEEILGENLPENIHDDYLLERNKIQAISKSAHKSVEIKIK